MQRWTEQILRSKVSSQGHSETICGQVRNLRAFSHLCAEYTDVFHWDSSQLPLTGPYDTDDIFKVMGSKFKVTDKINIKMHFLSEGIPVCGSLLKTFYCSLSLYVFYFLLWAWLYHCSWLPKWPVMCELDVRLLTHSDLGLASKWPH